MAASDPTDYASTSSRFEDLAVSMASAFMVKRFRFFHGLIAQSGLTAGSGCTEKDAADRTRCAFRVILENVPAWRSDVWSEEIAAFIRESPTFEHAARRMLYAEILLRTPHRPGWGRMKEVPIGGNAVTAAEIVRDAYRRLAASTLSRKDGIDVLLSDDEGAETAASKAAQDALLAAVRDPARMKACLVAMDEFVAEAARTARKDAKYIRVPLSKIEVEESESEESEESESESEDTATQTDSGSEGEGEGDDPITQEGSDEEAEAAAAAAPEPEAAAETSAPAPPKPMPRPREDSWDESSRGKFELDSAPAGVAL